MIEARDVIRRWEGLNGDRGTWLTHWQQIANYMLPNRADYITERAPGMKRMNYIYNGVALWAVQQFASGLHSLLTSPTLRWFVLRAKDEALNADQQSQAWLDDVTDRMYAVYNGPENNFASQSGELYLDLATIGTGVMAQLQSPRGGILFSTRHLKECVVAENDEDRVDTLVRRWQYTAEQAVRAWGDACGPVVQKAAVEQPDRKFAFLHMVAPRRSRDAQRGDARNKPYLSAYVCEEDSTLIGEGGFDEFPYHVPRFSKVAGEIYGRGPGMIALPDVKMLNTLMQIYVKAAQKKIDPPLQLPDDGFLMPLKTTPGSLNFYRAGTRDRIEPIRTEGDLQLGMDLIQYVSQQVVRAFNVEWMVMPSDMQDPASSGKGITATYVLQQRDEKMRLLSPMLARLQSEFLGPLIDRTFAIMWRQSKALRFGPGSMLAPPPPQISGAALRVEYVSPIAVAQKTSQIDGVSRVIQMAQTLATMDQKAVRTLDTDAILRMTAADLNTPAAVLKSPERVAAEAQAEQEAQQAMNDHAALANVAKAARDGGAGVKSLNDAMAPPDQAQPAQAAA